MSAPHEPSLSSEVLQVERQGPIAIVTLTRPHRHNALTQPLADALLDFFMARRRDRDCKVIVLRGAGEHFCAGLDLIAATQGDAIAADADRGDWPVADLLRAMRACPQPVIALVRGSVVGAGLALMLAADIVLASETTLFCTAFIDLGLSGSELGVAWRLQRTLGLSLARELIYSSAKLDAATAAAAGLVSRAVADEALDEQGLVLAHKIALASDDALRLTKRNLDLSLQSSSLEAAIELEERAQIRLAKSEAVNRAVTDFAAKHAKN